MPIELWLDQSVVAIFATLALVLTGTGAVWIVGLASAKARMRPVPLVASYFTAVSLLFGLLTGFAASDAWERNRAATRAVLSERDGITALLELSKATASDMSAIRSDLRSYLDAVITDEWPRMRDGLESPRAEEELSRLLTHLADPRISAEAGGAAHATMLQLWQRVHAARSDRFALSERATDSQKWFTVLILAVLTQLCIAWVHLDDTRAQVVAVALFSTAALVTLGLIALKERPFDGPLATPPSALQKILDRLPAGPA